MKNTKCNPKKFLDVTELSAFENQNVKGGASQPIDTTTKCKCKCKCSEQ